MLRLRRLFSSHRCLSHQRCTRTATNNLLLLSLHALLLCALYLPIIISPPAERGASYHRYRHCYLFINYSLFFPLPFCAVVASTQEKLRGQKVQVLLTSRKKKKRRKFSGCDDNYCKMTFSRCLFVVRISVLFRSDEFNGKHVIWWPTNLRRTGEGKGLGEEIEKFCV